MIRLDSKESEKERIIELLTAAIENPQLECECLFNNSPNRNNPNITYNNFMSILKRYKNNPDFETKTVSRLTISFPESSKLNNVRVLVKGTGAINTYCNSDSLNGLLNSVDFETKSRPKMRFTNVLIPNYDIKFNLKMESNFNTDGGRIRDIMQDWNDLNKNFRYKKTFSFIKKSQDFQIDVSIVKSSTNIDRYLSVKEVIDNNLLRFVVLPQDVKMSFTAWWKTMEQDPNNKVLIRNGSSYFKNIKDSNVFNNLPTYEVEIEYIHNKTNPNPKFRNIEMKKDFIQREFVSFFKQIGSVLQCIQDSNFILSYTDKQEIRKKYIKTVLASIDETMLKTPNKSMSLKITTSQVTRQKAKPSVQQQQQQSGGSSSANTNMQKQIQMNSDNEIQYTNATDEENDNHITDDDNNATDDNNDTTSEHNSDDDLEEVDIEQTGGNPRKLMELKNRVEEGLTKNRGRGIFFGPLIVDLEHKNAMQLDRKSLIDPSTNTNIHINYVVTDKTDGERYLLFIDDIGNTYAIGRDNSYKSFGVVLPGLANSILDGEFINKTEDDRPLNNFYIFDAYIFRSKAVLHLPFLFNRPEGRHNCILEAVKYFSTASNITQHNVKMPFLLFKKDYLPSNSSKTYANLLDGEIPLISQNCFRLLNKMNRKYGGFLEEGHLFPYKTDGLVFLPNNLGLFQENENHHVANPFKQGRWYNNYKWKPADHLTIDFKVNFVKNIDNEKLSYQYINSEKYLSVIVKSAVFQPKHPKDKDNNYLNFYLLNSGIDIKSIPQDFPFLAVNPFIGYFTKEGVMQNNMSDALFLVDKNDNVICHNGDIITDGQIVECSYDIANKNENMRWQPHRIRPDKKEPNNYLTAVSTWHLINNPITKEQLSCMTDKTMQNMYGDEEDEEKQEQENEKLEKDKQKQIEIQNIIQTENLDKLDNVAYYSDSQEKLTQPFKKFSNFVKDYIIKRATSGFVKPRLMDLAVGELGDLHKYVYAGVHTLLGIEIGFYGLNNMNKGACTRLIELSRGGNPAYAKLASRTMLIVGDSTKNIALGECSSDPLNKYYLDVLYGNARGNTPKLKKMEGVGLDKFDVITCMFAIHYMMNNEAELDSFLRNVSENLVTQGYFIGTCLDGVEILKQMGNNDEIQGIINDKTVFFIRKLSDDKDAYKDIKTGNKVLAYFETFSGAFKENLVNMSYLREKAKEHHLKLVEYKTFLEEPGNMLSQYDTTDGENAKYAKEIRNTPAMMTWSRMNAYFIFQKIRDD